MTDEPFQEYTLEQIPEGEHLRLWERHDWTRQEEAFAREFIRTGDRVKAYVHAFPGLEIGRQALYTRARALLFQDWMQDYIAFDADRTRELLRRGADEILDEITKIAKANMADFYTVDEFGTPQFDLSGLTRHQSAAIQELQIDTYVVGKGDNTRDVRSVKMKLAPKTSALELMGKNQKLFTDVLAHENVGDEIEEIRRARERARLKAAKPETGDDDDEDERQDGGS